MGETLNPKVQDRSKSDRKIYSYGRKEIKIQPKKVFLTKLKETSLTQKDLPKVKKKKYRF